ncbi:MAG: hypothetical protein SGARI_002776 [Bacillariaceae sp.]
MKVLPLLQQAFPTAIGYENVLTVVQANAEGHLVKIQYDQESPNNNDDNNNNNVGSVGTCPSQMPASVFVKTVDAAQYSEKKWADLRRTLMYCRTEVRFYAEILPGLLQSTNATVFANATPQIFLAEYDLDGLITEEAAATDPSGNGPVQVDWMTANKGGFLVMEGISHEDYYQDSPIVVEQAKQTLAAIAGLHAAAWEDQAVLTRAENRLSRGSYHLKTRNPKELEGIQEAWAHFVDAFRDLDEGGVFDRCGPDFGKRIQNLAEYVCDRTSPGPKDAYATISHGDFKAMNCFLPVEGREASKERGVVMVDFASIGVGLGMQDVAMHVHHAVRPADLDNGGEMLLVDHYLNVLKTT